MFNSIRFRDLTIRKKLFILSAAAFLFIGTVIIIGIIHMLWMKDSALRLYDESLLEAQKLLELKTHIEESRRAVLSFIVDPGTKAPGEHMKTIAGATQRLDNNLQAILSSGHFDSEIIPEVLRLRSIWESYRKTRDSSVIPSILAGEKQKAASIAMGAQEERFEEFIKSADALVLHENMDALSAQESLKHTFANGIALYALISTGGLIAVSLLIFYMSRDMGGRFKGIMAAIEEFNAGELKIKISGEGKDELGRLANSLNRMFRRLYEDNIVHDQYTSILKWESEEKEKKAGELERLNSELKDTQREIEVKNASLEKSLIELIDANQKLADTREQMVQSEKMASIGQLAAGVAHEINNPVGFVSSNLNTLSGYIDSFNRLIGIYNRMAGHLTGGKMEEALRCLEAADALKKEIDLDFASSDVIHLIDESNDGLARIKSIVKGLRDFSHTAGEEMELADINECVGNAIKLSWHEIKYKAGLAKDFGGLPRVLCRPQQITQVFLNMIINALQAMPERGDITIRTYTQDKDVAVEIRDNGTGIPEDAVKKIFDPFFTTKPVGKGTGLGLSIAYGIISDHKGSIEVNSKAGQGTTFIIKLPAANNAASAAR